MNQNLQQLFQIAQKKERYILGLMSGTSLDGLDIALCKIQSSGLQTKCVLEKFETYSYSSIQREVLSKVVSQQNVSLEELTTINAWLGDLFAQMIIETLEKWNISNTTIDCIASHGQTIFHAPQTLHQKSNFPNATLQIADADHIAYKTGIITIHDFRQKHIASGGEGAPLAVYGDYLLFSDSKEDRFLVNIGGIANFTFLPKNLNKHQVFATDVGTGNTLIDFAMQQYFKQPYDKNGETGRKGRVNFSLLGALQNHHFFQQDFPKSTGLELFNTHYLENALKQSKNQNLSKEDMIATLTYFSAWGIAVAIQKFINVANQTAIILSGGGAYNDLLLENIQHLLPRNVNLQRSDFYGMQADAKEAILFAILANETLMGEGISIGNQKPVCLGKFSFPS